MLWYVKRGMVKSTLLDENHLPISYIRCQEGIFFISDIEGNQSLKINQLSPQSLHIQSREQEGTAMITYGDSDFLMRPPRALLLTLSWDNAAITIEQSEKRDFSLFYDDTPIGSITGMFKHTAKICLKKDFPADLVALLYILALHMYHEDDVNLV